MANPIINPIINVKANFHSKPAEMSVYGNEDKQFRVNVEGDTVISYRVWRNHSVKVGLFTLPIILTAMEVRNCKHRANVAHFAIKRLFLNIGFLDTSENMKMSWRDWTFKFWETRRKRNNWKMLPKEFKRSINSDGTPDSGDSRDPYFTMGSSNIIKFGP